MKPLGEVTVLFGPYTFECVYWDSQMNKKDHILAGISRRIATAYRCYFELHQQFGEVSKILRATKIRIYKTPIRLVVMYRSEIWGFIKVMSETYEYLKEGFHNVFMAH